MNKYMEMANVEAKKNALTEFKNGGPFGAVIVKDGEVISKAHNTVLKDNDPTAHAEVNAIRKAGQFLKTNDLSGCTLYTSCFPCPMCLSAAIWANINTIYYGNTKEDAAAIGFRDDYIYEALKDINANLNIIQMDREETIKIFEEFKEKPTLY